MPEGLTGTSPEGAAGTVYQVRRKLGNQSAFEFVGAVGTRKFTDITLPIGTSTAMYTVTGQRAESIGAPSTPFTLMFGIAGGAGGGGGGLTIEGQFMEDDSNPGTLEFKQAA